MDTVLEATIIAGNEATPDEFFVQTKKQLEGLDSLSAELEKTCLNENCHTIKNGIIRVVHEKKSKRAKFLGACEEMAKVFLVDEGIDALVPFGKCSFLCQVFAKKPSNCIRCHIAVLPKENEAWSPECLQYFNKIVTERLYDLDIIQRQQKPVLFKDELSLEVDLVWSELVTDGPFARERKVQNYMSQKLISQGFAKVKMDEKEMSEIECSESLNKDESISLGGEAITEVMGKKVSNWLPPRLSLAPMGRYARIEVTHVDDKGVIFYHHHNDHKLLRQMQDLFSNIYTLTNESLYDEVHQNWKEGDACVALYIDDRWYRARILQKVDRQNFLLNYVDFGNDNIVDFKEIRPAFHYEEIPCLALKAVLHGIAPNKADSDVWDASVLDNLYAYINYSTKKDVRLKFHEAFTSSHDPVKAHVCVKEGENRHVSVARRMVKLGQAKEINN